LLAHIQPTSDKIQVCIIANETQAMVVFPTTAKAGPDMGSAFCSNDPEFHEWCIDYFDFKWDKARTFDSKKLVEVQLDSQVI
jgi:hypothetical protein